MTKIYKSTSLKKYSFILICTLLISNSVFCETSKLKITVLDNSTCETIPFVAVTLSQNGKQIAALISDLDGNAFFKDLPVGLFSLQATYLGYEACAISNLKTESNKTTYIDVNLKPRVISLKECVIVSYRIPLVDRGCYWGCCLRCRGILTDDELIENKTSVLDTLKPKSIGFKLYPNPTIDKVTLELDGKINEVFIADISGKQIRKITATNQIKLEIDMSNLTRGVYLLQFNHKGKQESSKVVLTN